MTADRPGESVCPVMVPVPGSSARPFGRGPDVPSTDQVLLPGPLAVDVIWKGVETTPLIGPFIVTTIASPGSFGVTGGTPGPESCSSLTRKLKGEGPLSALDALAAMSEPRTRAARRDVLSFMAIGSEGLIRHFAAFRGED